MNINITMLNVKDGDAIIVELQKKKDSFVMLIDGGEPGYSKLVTGELDKVLKKHNKKGPDLVVCTHYDSDHIGGLAGVIKHYGKNTGHVWIHRTQAILDMAKVKAYRAAGSSMFPSTDQVIYRSAQKADYSFRMILESIKQEARLLELIDGLNIPSSEPLCHPCPVAAWPEIRILGPTPDYYLKLFPKKIDKLDFLTKEYHALKADMATKKTSNPCVALNNTAIKKVTAPNLCSAVILITDGTKKFLFAADAGIPSFENIPKYKKELKDIYWLKVPHHASSNNISCNLIELMKPEYAYISGDKYVSADVVKAFKDRSINLESTKKGKHIYFSYP